MSFKSLNLSEAMLQNLSNIGYTSPTPIQVQSIPFVLAGNDIIGQAQTGTGKTASFSIPLIEKMQANQTTQALILVPTRELAIQVAESFKSMSQHTRLRVTTVFGGAPFDKQIKSLKEGYECVVATPGRCIDLLNKGVLKTQDIDFLVLDEVDEMLNMGFIEDVETIVDSLPKGRQTLFFSATMTPRITQIAEKFLDNPKYVKIARSETTANQITQTFIELRDGQKMYTLLDLIHTQNPERAIIFAKTKKRVDEIADELAKEGFGVDRIHGDLSQEQRGFTFKRFRSGQIRILVATDVAARGLDIEDISHVYNFDMPNDVEYYVHRIGRTGRAGKSGIAVAFVTSKERNSLLPMIERHTKTRMERLVAPTVTEVLDAIEYKAQQALENIMSEKIEDEHFKRAKKLLEVHNSLTLVAAALQILTPTIDKVKFIKDREKANERRPGPSSPRTSSRFSREREGGGSSRGGYGRDNRRDAGSNKDSRPSRDGRRDNVNEGRPRKDGDEAKRTSAAKPFEKRSVNSDKPFEKRNASTERPSRALLEKSSRTAGVDKVVKSLVTNDKPKRVGRPKKID